MLPEIYCLTPLNQSDMYLMFTILCLSLAGTSNSQIFSTPSAIPFMYITKWADARTKIGVQVKLPDIPTVSDMLILWHISRSEILLNPPLHQINLQCCKQYCYYSTQILSRNLYLTALRKGLDVFQVTWVHAYKLTCLFKEHLRPWRWPENLWKC